MSDKELSELDVLKEIEKKENESEFRLILILIKSILLVALFYLIFVVVYSVVRCF